MARSRNKKNGQFEASLTAMQNAQASVLQALAGLAQNQTALMARMAR